MTFPISRNSALGSYLQKYQAPPGSREIPNPSAQSSKPQGLGGNCLVDQATLSPNAQAGAGGQADNVNLHAPFPFGPYSGYRNQTIGTQIPAQGNSWVWQGPPENVRDKYPGNDPRNKANQPIGQGDSGQADMSQGVNHLGRSDGGYSSPQANGSSQAGGNPFVYGHSPRGPVQISQLDKLDAAGTPIVWDSVKSNLVKELKNNPEFSKLPEAQQQELLAKINNELDSAIEKIQKTGVNIMIDTNDQGMPINLPGFQDVLKLADGLEAANNRLSELGKNIAGMGVVLYRNGSTSDDKTTDSEGGYYSAAQERAGKNIFLNLDGMPGSPVAGLSAHTTAHETAHWAQKFYGLEFQSNEGVIETPYSATSPAEAFAEDFAVKSLGKKEDIYSADS